MSLIPGADPVQACPGTEGNSFTYTGRRRKKEEKRKTDKSKVLHTD